MLYMPNMLIFLFFRAWDVLSWYPALCIRAQNPQLPQSCLYRGPEAVLCSTHCSSEPHEQFIHMKIVINLVHRRDRPSTSWTMKRELGEALPDSPLRTSFIYLLFALSHARLVCDANGPSPSCPAEQPQSSQYGKGHGKTLLLPCGCCGMLYLITRKAWGVMWALFWFCLFAFF